MSERERKRERDREIGWEIERERERVKEKRRDRRRKEDFYDRLFNDCQNYTRVICANIDSSVYSMICKQGLNI